MKLKYIPILLIEILLFTSCTYIAPAKKGFSKNQIYKEKISKSNKHKTIYNTSQEVTLEDILTYYRGNKELVFKLKYKNKLPKKDDFKLMVINTHVSFNLYNQQISKKAKKLNKLSKSIKGYEFYDFGEKKYQYEFVLNLNIYKLKSVKRSGNYIEVIINI